jgi:hypothetical protein
VLAQPLRQPDHERPDVGSQIPIATDALAGTTDPLTRLAIKYGTDKWGAHFYTPVYHALLSPLRNRPIRLLEIGIGGYDLRTIGGNSLAMWAEYFPQALVTGIDVAEKCLALGPRVKLFRGSQDDPTFLKGVCTERGPFDVIIDDGSHVPKQLTASFHLLFPSLTDGGIYIIEDMQTAFWPQFGGSMLHGGDTLKLVRTIIQCLNHAEIAVVDRSPSLPPFARQIKSLRALHNLLIIEKGDNREPSNFAYDLNNPYAQAAVAVIEHEMQIAPTAEGLANLIDVYVRGGNLNKATEIGERAVALWPRNGTALMAAYLSAKLQGNTRAKIDYLERILQIEPGHPAIQQALAQARTELNTAP